MASPVDLERLKATAIALGDLKDELVFLGGTTTSLLVTDPAAPPTRVSFDVDAVLPVANRNSYYEFERKLREERGFEQRAENPICRWFRDDIVLDVMPDDSSILGFSNRWYAGAHEHAVSTDVGGVSIRVVTTPWFLATKLEAFAGRGGGDYGASRDVEDIIAVVDGRDDVAAEVDGARSDVRAFLIENFAHLSAIEPFVIAIAGHLAGDSARAGVVFERVRAVAALWRG